MCIIFLHCDQSSRFGKYKLVIAANRDESFSRRAKQADFLANDSNVLCGIDLQDKINGTWLGVTKKGKFGFVTNYLTLSTIEPGASRGSVVKNFLSSSYTPNEYNNSVLKNEFLRPFNFIGGQVFVNESKIDMSYYSNFDDSSPFDLLKDCYVLTNTSLNSHWNKAKHGTEVFKSILKTSAINPNDLTEILMTKLLSDKTSLYPDRLIESQCNSKFDIAKMKSYCSVMVGGLPDYGTRAQTVVLVDDNNHMYFTERSLVVDDQQSLLWNTCSYDFPIES